MTIDNTKLGLLVQQQYGNNNYSSGLKPLSGNGSSTQNPKVNTGLVLTPYEKDMADFRNYLPQNNGTGDLNPFSVTNEQGQNLYLKEGSFDNKKSFEQEKDFQTRGQDVLTNNFNGDSIAAMEYLNQLELV